jgi:hypothetical protein
MGKHHGFVPVPRMAEIGVTGAIRQAAGRGVTADGQLIAKRFPNRFSIFRDGRRV